MHDHLSASDDFGIWFCTVWGWYLLTAYLALLVADAAWAALQLARPALNPAWAAANLTEAQVLHWTRLCAGLCIVYLSYVA